jgi:NitT/TauT family transport system permease protein
MPSESEMTMSESRVDSRDAAAAILARDAALVEKEARLRRRVSEEFVKAERKRRVTTISSRIGLTIAIFLGWEFLSGRYVDEFFVSKPSDIIYQLYLLAVEGRLIYHLTFTLQEAVYGYLIGIGSGIFLGVICGRYDILYRMVEPFVVAMYGIPRIALAPLFILWFGLGILAKIVISAVLVFFIIFMNTVTGIRNVDPQLLEVVTVMGASERQKMWKVILPAAAPFIITSMRVCVPLAMIGAIVGEFISTNRGIGYLLTEAAGAFETGMLFAGIFILLAVVMAMNFCINLLESKLTRWKPKGGQDIVVE